MIKEVMDVNGKYILITGASGGIGKATAIEFAKQGYSLYLHYHSNKEAIEQLMEELKPFGVECMPIQADLSVPEGVEKLCANIFSLNGIVLNSGKSYYGLVNDMSMDMINESIQLHMTSPFLIVQKLLPKLMKQPKSAIVAVTSIWGDTGASCEVLYSMVKGGQNAFVKALSKELAPMGIRVNAVSPGAVKTQMLNGFSDEELQQLEEEIPLGRLAEPEEIASSIVYLLSDASSYITGQIMRVNGGWYT